VVEKKSKSWNNGIGASGLEILAPQNLNYVHG